jgi:hypothetical protein
MSGNQEGTAFTHAASINRRRVKKQSLASPPVASTAANFGSFNLDCPGLASGPTLRNYNPWMNQQEYSKLQFCVRSRLEFMFVSMSQESLEQATAAAPFEDWAGGR